MDRYIFHRIIKTGCFHCWKLINKRNLKNLIFKLGSAIKRIRWKVYFFETPNEIDDATTINNFGFKSVLTPTKNEHANAFEESYTTWCVMLSLNKLIQYSQINLIKIFNMINKDPLLFMTADKSNNLYKVSKNDYSKLLEDSITKSFKKYNVALINNINK